MSAEEREKIPLWLVALLDQRIARISENLKGASPYMKQLLGSVHILSTLTDPPEDATPAEMKLWDTTCDRCRDPEAEGFTTHTVTSAIEETPITITFGVCSACWNLP